MELERLNPQYVVECFQGQDLAAVGVHYQVLIHSMSWNAFRGHPLGTRLNTGFQKAFFNQPFLSTTSRRLFLEEFSLTR